MKRIANDIEVKMKLKIKKAANPDKVCRDCGFSVGMFGCMNRSLCPDLDNPGHNFYRERPELINQNNER